MKKFLVLLLLISLTFIMALNVSATSDGAESSVISGIPDNIIITLIILAASLVVIALCVVSWVKNKNGKNRRK